MAKRARLDSDYEDSSDEEIGPKNPVVNKKLNRTVSRKFQHLAVIDLDQTLIDKKYCLLEGADTFLNQLNSLGYYIILWTAGSDHHVKTFFKDYPICKLYINDYITGLIDNCKPVSVARKKLYGKIRNYLGANIFIDDNLGNIEKSDYDYKFCVLDYLDASDNINFLKLLTAIKKVK